MRSAAFSLILLLLLSLPVTARAQQETPPEGGQPKDFVLPAKTKLKLDNGLAVTLVQYGMVPKVTIQAMVRSGNINEAENELWLADLTGDMMKEGTVTLSAEELATKVAGMGGSLSINVGPDQTSIGGSVLTEFGPGFVALLADVMEHPRFPESELARVKNDKVRELTIDLTDPSQVASARFAKALYPDHPYGRIFPTENMLRGYTINQVKTFYNGNFGALRTHIYVVGKFDEEKIVEAIRKGFSEWARGPEPLMNVPKPVSKREIHLIDRPDAPQSTVILGLPVPNPSDPDYKALLVTDALLGGSFASRITTNIREEKGYTYSPRSSVSTRYRDAYWREFASVTTSVTGPSLKEIFYEIDRLQKSPPSAEELKGIQNYLAGIFVIRNSTPGGIIGQLAFLDLHGLPDSYFQDYVKDIYAVTPAQVQEITVKYLRPQEMTIVIAGDKKKIEKQIAPFGKIVG
jgi:zinc protease